MKKKVTSQSARPPADDITLCPVARAESLVGDRWTVLIIRELLMGNHRFEELQVQTEATPQMLATRLKKLEVEGLIERRLYSQRPIRHEYFLTEMGQALHPVLLALSAWGETWCKADNEEVAIHYLHVPCGQNPGFGPGCQHCGAVIRRADLQARFSDAYAEERKRRRQAFKAESS